MLYYYDSFIFGELLISDVGLFPFIFFITFGFSYADGVPRTTPLFMFGFMFIVLFIAPLLAYALELMAAFIFGEAVNKLLEANPLTFPFPFIFIFMFWFKLSVFC